MDNSMARRLRLIVAVSVIPLLVVILVGVVYVQRDFANDTWAEKSVHAKLLATSYGFLVQDIDRHLLLLARLAPDLAANEAARVAAALVETVPSFEHVFIADAGGNVTLVVPPAEVETIADRDYFRTVLATGGATLSEPLISRGSSNLTVVAARPLAGGLVGITVNLDRVQQGLLSHADVKDTALLVVDRRGGIVSGNGAMAFAPGDRLPESGLLQALREGRGSWTGSVTDQGNWAFHIEPVTGAPWYILVGVHRYAWRSAVLGLLAMQLGTLAVAVVIALGLARSTGRRLLQPVQALAGAARAFAQGEHRPVVESGPTELRALGRAFNEMLAERSQSEARLRDMVRHLELLLTIDRAVLAATPAAEVLAAVVGILVTERRTACAAVLLVDEQGEWQVAASSGLGKDQLLGEGRTTLRALAARALAAAGPVTHRDSQAPAGSPQHLLMAYPLQTEDQQFGALVCCGLPDEPQQDQQVFHSGVAAQLAVTLQHDRLRARDSRRKQDLEVSLAGEARAREDLRRLFEDTLYLLARAGEARDEYTGDHLRRIEHYTRALAQALELAPDEVEAIAKASLLHDVGKLAIPDGILRKPGKLDAAEWEVMQTHSVQGQHLLGEGEAFALARQIARWHHEAWDGSGYPDGLKGEQIPLAARIVAVADIYDALTSRRPYKQPWPPDQALAELMRLRGTRVEPRLASAAETLFEKGILQEIQQRYPDHQPPGQAQSPTSAAGESSGSDR